MRPALLYRKKRTRKTKPKLSGYRGEATIAYKRAFEQLFGSQGAASPVRRIDPVTGRVVEIIKPVE
jgi:hypothetical protein